MSFNDTGTFYVYIEHLGTLEALDGDCDASTDEYSRDPDDPPVVEITMLDDEENEIEFDRVDEEFTYSLDDSFAGTATRQVEIESNGDYVVNVASADDDFVVAVGREPRRGGRHGAARRARVGRRRHRARTRARAVGRPPRSTGETPRDDVHRRNRVAGRSSDSDLASADGPAAHPTDASTATCRPVVTGTAGRATGRVARSRTADGPYAPAGQPSPGPGGATARVRPAWDADPAGRTEPERAGCSAGGT